jgi:hypothetical protein
MTNDGNNNKDKFAAYYQDIYDAFDEINTECTCGKILIKHTNSRKKERKKEREKN